MRTRTSKARKPRVPARPGRLTPAAARDDWRRLTLAEQALCLASMKGPPLKAPFPAFGGKSKVARMVWPRFGAVANYAEPFCFSAAMLLLRPPPVTDGGPDSIVNRRETINDANAYVANFWRAIAAEPGAVARFMDWPVNEADMHARHQWLARSPFARDQLAKVRADPDFYNPKIAGWWCWGLCLQIGSGWCDDAVDERSRPDLRGMKIHAKRPSLGNERGVHGGRPQLADAFSRGRGVHGRDDLLTTNERRQWLIEWCQRLADRFRSVRVCCGQWTRICDSESVLTRLGITGVFLDPPYAHDVGRAIAWLAFLRGEIKSPPGGTAKSYDNRNRNLYANDRTQDVDQLVAQVTLWCLKWGDNRRVRVALCGLDGEYPALEAAGWKAERWTKPASGYGNRTERGRANAGRERIWFSPHCVPVVRQAGLFD